MSDTAVVALVSALVSLVVSLMTTSLRNRADLSKLQREQEHGYAKALFEKRVECYPELYSHLSGYTKKIRSQEQNLENFAAFRQEIDNWNNQHSLFFTRPTSAFSAKFRYLMSQILQSEKGETLPVDDWESMRKLIRYYESFLKAEIGIYSTKPVGSVTEYDDAIKFVDDLISKWQEHNP